MQSLNTHQRFFVAGQPVELWEDPRLPFGCAFDDLETYCMSSRWELLFNAIVLACLALQESEDEDVRRPPNWAWAFGGMSGAFPDEDGPGH